VEIKAYFRKVEDLLVRSEFEENTYQGRREDSLGYYNTWMELAWLYIHLSEVNSLPRNRGLIDRIHRHLESIDLSDLDEKRCCTSFLLGVGAVPHLYALTGGDRVRLARMFESTNALASSSEEEDFVFGLCGYIFALIDTERRCQHKFAGRDFKLKLLCRLKASIERLLVSEDPLFLGISHGVAGYLPPMVCLSRDLGLDPDLELIERSIHFITAHSFSDGVCLLVPRESQTESVQTQGWCHGSPGVLVALGYLYDVLRLGYLESLVTALVRSTLRHRSSLANYCCGNLGSSMSLLYVHALGIVPGLGGEVDRCLEQMDREQESSGSGAVFFGDLAPDYLKFYREGKVTSLLGTPLV
jgi:hypothetical protein